MLEERRARFSEEGGVARDEREVERRRRALERRSVERLGGGPELVGRPLERSRFAKRRAERVPRLCRLDSEARRGEEPDTLRQERGRTRGVGAGQQRAEVEQRCRPLHGIAVTGIARQALFELADRVHPRILLDVRVLVAGVGNVLRRDDGFGVAVIDRLAREALPPGVVAMDFGIGGIHLVQELLDPVAALIVVDAVELGGRPGTVSVVRPVVRKPEGRDDLADMHYSTPDRALMLAGALDVLPSTVWVVGCEPLDASSVGQGLTPPVEAAVDVAVAEIRSLLAALDIDSSA